MLVYSIIIIIINVVTSLMWTIKTLQFKMFNINTKTLQKNLNQLSLSRSDDLKELYTIFQYRMLMFLV